MVRGLDTAYLGPWLRVSKGCDHLTPCVSQGCEHLKAWQAFQSHSGSWGQKSVPLGWLGWGSQFLTACLPASSLSSWSRRPLLRAADNMVGGFCENKWEQGEAVTQNPSDLHQLPIHSVFGLCFVILWCRLVCCMLSFFFLSKFYDYIDFNNILVTHKCYYNSNILVAQTIRK